MIVVDANLATEVFERVSCTVRTETRDGFRHVAFRAMSTAVHLAFRPPRLGPAWGFERAAVEWVARFEARYSRFLPGSIVCGINAAAGGGWVEFDEEAERLFSTCDEMARVTGGVFDPAALPLLRLWDWKADPPVVPDDLSTNAARALCGWDKVHRRPRGVRLPTEGMGIDLGGIGKEFAVDELLRMARGRGIRDVMIDIGQDLRVSGQPAGRDAWCVGLEEPDQPGHCWAALRLSDRAVATSGDYFRSFTRDGRRYGHILDPRTGRPADNGCQAVSVVAPSCVLAGVLSTAAFVLGPEHGLQLIQEFGNVEACITTRDARHQTRRFSSYVQT